ncbi:MAG: hypothetical protein IPP57_28130 [Candidatus Obscuribacter sp.]|nr:hypothetical protein [Candidatus Obscuribacter sp.]MBK7838852.1 hypothetical protein [Candidatus Obscuribacter sp.]MBK9619613.1 hypothetical protein [Candidatus Obscuribacter sp.]MBK9774649.1 hypothetical protein [Candidatus Obscuribacter sp.]MBL0185132.1 hypothetical protein [Candidatus Obscuribacter sp.]
MLFIIGLIFMGGGGVLTKQGFDDAKNVFETLVFGMLVMTMGFMLCIWTFAGPPD